MKQITLQDIVKKIDKMPGHFYVAMKALKMLESNPDLSIHELSNIISLDQSLTTSLLKLCNSAEYGFSRKIASLKDALTNLGLKTVKNLVFSVLSERVLNHEIKGYALGKGELWKNSVSCAFYARHIAKIAKYKDPETAFTASLLRDIGKLLIHQYVGKSYNQIINIINSENIPFIEAENKILGFNHGEVGHEMALKWNFPTILADTIKYHHNPDEAVRNKCEDIDLILIAHIADTFTMLLGKGLGIDGMMYNPDVKTFEKLKIPNQSNDIEKLLSDMIELNFEIESMIGNIDEK